MLHSQRHNYKHGDLHSNLYFPEKLKQCCKMVSGTPDGNSGERGEFAGTPDERKLSEDFNLLN